MYKSCFSKLDYTVCLFFIQSDVLYSGLKLEDDMSFIQYCA